MFVLWGLWQHLFVQLMVSPSRGCRERTSEASTLQSVAGSGEKKISHENVFSLGVCKPIALVSGESLSVRCCGSST